MQTLRWLTCVGVCSLVNAWVLWVCREAALAALREDMEGASEVAARHFFSARLALSPSLTPELLAQYEEWGQKYQR